MLNFYNDDLKIAVKISLGKRFRATLLSISKFVKIRVILPFEVNYQFAGHTNVLLSTTCLNTNVIKETT